MIVYIYCFYSGSDIMLRGFFCVCIIAFNTYNPMEHNYYLCFIDEETAAQEVWIICPNHIAGELGWVEGHPALSSTNHHCLSNGHVTNYPERAGPGVLERWLLVLILLGQEWESALNLLLSTKTILGLLRKNHKSQPHLDRKLAKVRLKCNQCYFSWIHKPINGKQFFETDIRR